MVDTIDMSLDDIIKAKKLNRRGGKRAGGGFRGKGAAVASKRGAYRRAGGANGVPFRRAAAVTVGRGRVRGGGITRTFKRGDVNSAWKHDLFETYGNGGGRGDLAAARALIASAGDTVNLVRSGGSTKLMVSNLDCGVSCSDIEELFTEFGPLKRASVHYDQSGRSLGTADVIFERRADTIKAMKQYNGVPLDGRPMNIQIVTSNIPQTAVGAATAAAAANVRRAIVGGGGGGAVIGGRFRSGGARTFTATNKQRAATTAGGPRGGTRGGPRRNIRNQKQPTPTAEDLDAELEAYSKQRK